MKVRVVRLSEIDELLKDYKRFKNRGETFSQFIEVSKCIDKNEPAIFDWCYVEDDDLIEVEDED